MLWNDLRISRLSSGFRRLKRLELSGVSLDHSFTYTINYGCSFLEDLVLHYCRNDFDGIQSNTLKNLSVCTCASQVVDVLVVRAPCLASLRLDFPCYSYKNGLSLEAGNSLVRASISVEDGETSQGGQTILVGSLFNVTSLELDGFSAMYFEGTVGKRQMNGPSYLIKVKPVVGPFEFPTLGNLRTLFLDKCDLRDNFRILRHLLRSCPNLERLIVRLCELPEASTGGKGGGKLKTKGKGGAKSKKTHSGSGFRNLVRIQCRKLKSTEIIYQKGFQTQELVSSSAGCLGVRTNEYYNPYQSMKKR